MTFCVSVVIPYFNDSATILRALRSVLAQDLSPKEIIIVDDGSEFDEHLALKKILETDIRTENPVNLLRNSKNSGAASARNIGWERASSTYVAFLDADDAWHPLKLRLQVQLMESLKLDISSHLYSENCEMSSDLSLETVKWYTFSDFLIKNRCSTPSVVVRNDVNHRFLEGKRYSEDYLLWLMFAYNSPVPVINLFLARGFKKAWGEKGLSSNLSKMFLGQISSYKFLWSRGMIGFPRFLFLCFWSFVRYFRRGLIFFSNKLTMRNRNV